MNKFRIDEVDRRVSFIVAFQFIVMGIKNTLVNAVPFLYNINSKLNLLLIGIVFILYIYSFFILYRRKAHVGTILLCILTIGTILFTYVFYPQNVAFWKQYELRFLLLILPSAYLISKLNKLEYFKEYMTKGSYLLTIALIIFALAVYTIGHTVRDSYSIYSMSMANVAMLSIMWQLRAFLKEKNKISLIFSAVGLIVLLLYGSRNQLLAIMAYLICHVLSAFKHKIVGISVLAIFSSPILIFFKDIMSFIFNKLEQFGLSSRTVSLLIEGGIDESTQIRLDTYDKLKQVLFRNPLIGLGVSGDEASIGESAHSLYYSIWCTYGLFFGSILLLITLYLCLKSLKKSTGLHHQILVMYICMVFPRSFTGGDIWGNAVLWVLLGLCFMILRISKKRILY